MTRFLTWFHSFLRDIPGEDGAEWMIAEPDLDVRYRTFIYGPGNVSEWEGTTLWEERR